MLTFEADTGTQYSFTPPRAPHFGALWEAAVKAMKGHFYRSVENAFLTFEELKTLLILVVTILNSIPLVVQSEDRSVELALPPAHFLIGSLL